MVILNFLFFLIFLSYILIAHFQIYLLLLYYLYTNEFNNILFFIIMCVGNLVLFILLVIGATIVVLLYLFPISFCIINTGLIHFSSLPFAPSKLA